MKKHITIRDIADKTGYSMQTVSRVLNGRDDLHTESTSKKIRSTAEKMGYVQNIYAKAMKGSRTWSVGIIMDPFFGSYGKEIFVGAHDELFARGYCPILLLNNRVSDVELVNTLATRRVEGVMILPNPGMASRKSIAKIIQTYHLPLVSLDFPLTNLRLYDSVVTADEHGGRMAAEYLLEMGHRHTAGIFMNYQSLQRRKKGFEQVMKRKGGPPPLLLTDDALLDTEAAVKPIRAFLARQKKTTAVFSSTDHLLPAIYRAAQDLGLSIPEQLSVIGFGDLDFAVHLAPPATTFRQDSSKMGREAAKLLLDRIENPEQAIKTRSMKFEPELLVRSSVAAPRA